jgi:Domain of unknown function (DUF6881)
MRRYLMVTWHHDFPDEPVTLLSEIEHGEEIRKIEKYKDGRIGYAGADVATGSTVLSETLMPFEDEIAADPQFSVHPISAAEFEKQWRLAVDPADGGK